MKNFQSLLGNEKFSLKTKGYHRISHASSVLGWLALEACSVERLCHIGPSSLSSLVPPSTFSMLPLSLTGRGKGGEVFIDQCSSNLTLNPLGTAGIQSELVRCYYEFLRVFCWGPLTAAPWCGFCRSVSPFCRLTLSLLYLMSYIQPFLA